MKKKKNIRHSLHSHLRAAKMLHKISPNFFLITTLYAFFEALSPYVSIFFSAQILKELALLRRSDILWKWVISCIICIGLFTILKSFFYRRYDVLFEDLYGRKEILFAQKMFSMDYADIDQQQTHDLRSQINQNENWSNWGLIRVCNIYKDILKSIFGLLAGLTLTISLFTSPVPESAKGLTILNHPIFIIVLVVIIIIVSILAGTCNAKAVYYWSATAENATFGNRLFGFFSLLGTHQGRSMDIRLYNQQKLISLYLTKYNDFGVDGEISKISKGPLGIYSALGTGISILITGTVYIFTCLKAWAGAFDIGSITQYVGAATTMAGSIFELTELLGILKTNTNYLETTFKFMDIPNSMYQGSLTTEKRSDPNYQVEFKNVSFKYPGSDKWALRNINMRFKVGERLAIVGENGSGKTTFVKLLCRLYDPQEGQILLNGIDIKKYDYRDYMNIFSIVFQDFQLISQPLGANVAGNNNYDKIKVHKALIDSGFDDYLEKMPNGLNTQLYKNFTENGIEISGGEAQKIAIARALYKNAPFIILDEPTASLDPIAEAEIYSKFNDISSNKTAIYISHRLSSCKFCDEILVFHKGNIIQQGTHEQLLLDPKSKYYELWHAQAQYYKKPTI